MTKLTSGRVEKVDSANVSADRYQFLSLKEAEPDLGLPTTAGQVFTSNTTGSRYWTTLDTGNVVETSNLYYSNARVLSNVSLMSINVFADVDITYKSPGYGLIWDGSNWVANVITVSGTELSNVANTVLSIVQGQISGLQANNAIFSNTAAVANVAGLANVATFANVAAIANLSGLANVATFANVANISNIVVSISNFTTANLAESTSNLYYTNARSRAALSAGTGIIYDTANGIITANTSSILSGLSATVAGLTTANVAEAASNLYYTNTRSRLAISAGTGVIYDNSTGIISIGQNVSTGSDVTFNTVTILSNLSVYGNVTTFASNNLSVSDNMIYLNSNSLNSNPDLGFAGNYNDGTYRHTGFFRDASDGTWKVFDNYTPEPDANIFIDTSHASFRLANFAANSITAGIWNGLYTANVIESASNLYFTNARTRSALSAGTGIIYDTANGIITANTASILSGLSATVAGLTTANVAEATSNLYFTNARVLTALSNQTIQGNLTVTNKITANGIVANSIIINGIEIVTGGTNEANIVATRITSNIWNNLYTANVIETSGNLYFTNARVLAALSNATIQGNLTITNTLISNGLIVNGVEIVTGGSGEANITASRLTTNIVTANVWNGLYTANVIETSGNLYYSNARVLSALSNANIRGNLTINNILIANGIIVNGVEIVTGGANESNIFATRINANTIVANSITSNTWIGLYTANVIESNSNLYYTNARARSALSAGTGITYDPSTGVITATGAAAASNATYTGNVIAGNLIALGRLYANGITVNGTELVTGNTTESNINVTRITANVGIFANLVGSNLYFGNINSGNLVIGGGYGGNLTGAYILGTEYANINSNLIVGNINSSGILIANEIRANIFTFSLTTANVTEATSNLYFTNARVITALSNANIRGNLTINNILIANGLIVNGIEIVTGGANESNIFATRINANTIVANTITSNILIANGITISGVQIVSGTAIESNIAVTRINANTIVANSITSNNWAGIYTANVIETSGNLYFTNARVLTALSNANILGNLTINNILIANGLIVNGIEIVTGTSVESNIAGTRITANAITANSITTNSITSSFWSGLYTANVIESVSSLYYTNTRSRLAISAGTGIVYDSANGIITANLANITANVTATINGLTTADIDEVASNLYYTNTRSRLAISAGTGIVYDSATGIISANLANITANVTATVNGLTTADIDENAASGNLYYTNARVYSNVITLLSNIQGIVRATGNITTDANIIANGLIIRNINVADSVLAGNVTSNTSSATAFTANTITANTITANVWNRLYTANVIETSSNLYFTNARVYANVIALLPQYTGNLQLGNLAITNRITANILDIGPEQTGGTISGANTIATNTIIANTWIGLYTANVLEYGQIIFYTNARVFANVSEMSVNVLTDVDITGINTNQILIWNGTKFIPGNTGTSGLASNTSLTTANVAELPGNLYYTNARVYSNIISLLPYYTGALSGNNITATNSATVGNLIVLGNLFVGGNSVSFYANNLVVNDPMLQLGFGNPGDVYDLGFIGHYNDGAIERHAGFFRDHTDQKFKVFDNLTSEPGLNDLDTANATFRLSVIVAKTFEGNLIGNVTGFVSSISNFTTSNLIEGANLYFTNARVYANVTERLANLNMNVIPSANNVYSLGSPTARFKDLYLSGNTIDLGGVILSATNTDGLVIETITSNIWNRLYTANVIETASNLYFTNARVYANISPLLTTANVNEIASSGNLYYSNDRVYANISPLLTTANVSEVTNLYFTNSRAILAVIPAATQLTVTTPVFNYNIDQYSGDNPTIYVIAGETISFNLDIGASHPFNIRVSNGGSNYDTGLTHIATDGTVSTGSAAQGKVTGKLFWKVPYSLAGSTYVYQCTNHGSMVGNIVIQRPVSTITSANVPENTNLYYSNDRVYANISPLLTTANISEVTNLYYSNDRVYANVIILLANLAGEIRATGNIISDANIIANGLIIRNITVSDNVLAGNITASSANANAIVAVTINATGNITTDANLIANGLIIRNINVSDSVLTGSISSGNTTSNVILADSITANIWNRLYTANVIESDSNLFYTNARVRSALSAGSGISYDNNTGVISSTITTILSDSVTVISTGNLSYNIGTSVSDPKRILVSIEGMLQIPTTDYSVSGSTLTFPSAPPVGANIEVKFFGTETLNSTPTLVSKVDSFVATGSSLVFNLSMYPTSKDYVTVLIDGVLQQSDVYTLSGNTITLSDYPAQNANIDIRMIGGRVGSSYNTRTFTGNGAANTFTLTNGFTNDTVLVFENGVAQMPGSDYTITNDVLTFTTAPAANVIVQVRELGIAGPNVAAAISGFDQVTGNLVPTLDLIKNLGSSTKRWNQLYLKSNGLVLGNVTIGATDTTLTLTSNTGATTTLYTSLTAARAAAFGLSLIFGG